MSYLTHDDTTADPLLFSPRKRVRPLSSTDIASGRYSLSDILLPVPGVNVFLPENAVGER